MSVDLVVSTAISTTLQPISSQAGGQSGVLVATNATQVKGQDIVGAAMPLAVIGQAVVAPGQTWNRLVRLQNSNGQFFDLGIDASGNFFINSQNSTATAHVLTISQSGVVTIGNLALTNLSTAPGSSVDLAIGSDNNVYKQ